MKAKKGSQSQFGRAMARGFTEGFGKGHLGGVAGKAFQLILKKLKLPSGPKKDPTMKDILKDTAVKTGTKVGGEVGKEIWNLLW